MINTTNTEGDSTMTLDEFIEQTNIRSTARRVDSNPGMGQDMDHWRVTLRYMPGRDGAITVPFSMGRGHHGAEPTATDVLDCLASDAAGYDAAAGFEDWCGEYGYDTDSRTAERTYRAVERNAKKLRQWLGIQYQTLLYDTERL